MLSKPFYHPSFMILREQEERFYDGTAETHGIASPSVPKRPLSGSL